MKFLSIFTAVAITTLTPAYAQNDSNEQPWSMADVDNYLISHQVSSKKSSNDPFTKPGQAAAPAQRIVFRFPFLKPGQPVPIEPPFHTASWKYDATAELLTLETYVPKGGEYLRLNTLGQREAFRLKMFGMDVYADRQTGNAGVYQNAYGARVDVSTVTETSRGIGELRTVNGWRDELIWGEKYPKHTFRIAPEAARELTKHLVMEVEAVTKSWAPGKWVICGESGSAPSFDSPKRLSRDGCYLTVQYKAYRFIDARNGEILREWQ